MIVRQFVPSAMRSRPDTWILWRSMVVKDVRKQAMYKMLSQNSGIWVRTEVQA